MSDILPTEVRQLLAALELLSHGTTSCLDTASRGGDEQAVPPGIARPPHIRLREEYERASSDARREKVLGFMRDELRRARGLDVDRSHVREETAEQLAERIVADGAGLTVGEASIAFRCTATMVRRARVAAGFEPEHGRPLPETEQRLAAETAIRQEVARLHRNGMSVRAIAMATGVARTTVHDWIKAAA